MRRPRLLALVAILGVVAWLFATRHATPGRAERGSTRAAPSPAVGDTGGVSYGSFGAAAESLEAIVRRTFGAYADSAEWNRDSIETLHEGRPRSIPALRVRITATGEIDAPPDRHRLDEVLYLSGWRYDQDASEQGTDDGYANGMFCREAYCGIITTWEMKSINDSTRVRVPGTRIEIDCLPRIPEPQDPRIRKR